VGFDTDRQAERIFRLSRVQGKATKAGSPGSYEIPPGTDVSEVTRRLAPQPSTQRVVLLVRKGAGHTLRRGADLVEEGVPGPDTDSTWDRLVLERSAVGLVDEVLGYGADAYVEEPPQLRERVVERLRAALDQALDQAMDPTLDRTLDQTSEESA
jgi:proteasome accessory factor B